MALFPGEDMVGVQTPDGRVLQVPSSLAPPGLRIAAPIEPDDSPEETPQMGAPPVGAPAGAYTPPAVLPGIPAVPLPAAAPPVESADAVSAAAPVSAQGSDFDPVAASAAQKQDEANRKAFAAYAATDEGKLAIAQHMQQQSIEKQAADVQAEADVQAAGQLAVADAAHQRNEQIDALVLKQQQDAKADFEAQQRMQAKIGSMVDTLANTKIDREADHPILLALSAALVGWGEAEARQPITSGDIVMKAIDRKVAGQMQDIEQQKTILGLSREQLASMKDTASSRLALNSALIAAASNKAARQLEELAARSSSAQVKAAAAVKADQLREHGADQLNAAAQHQQDHNEKVKEHKDTIGVAIRGQDQAWLIHKDTMELEREKLAEADHKAEIAARATLSAADQKRRQELADKNVEQGIINPVTKEPLLMQKGYDKLEVAKRLDDKANQIEQGAKGPLNKDAAAQVEALRTRAADIRDDAKVTDALRLNTVEIPKIKEQIGGAQHALTLIDDIKNLADTKEGGRTLFSTNATQAAIQEKMTELMMSTKTGWKLGVLSKRDIDIVEKALGADPSKWDLQSVEGALGHSIVGTDPQAFKSRLDSLADGMIDQVMTALGPSWDAKDPHRLFYRRSERAGSPLTKADENIRKEKTPLEEATGNSTKLTRDLDEIRQAKASGPLYTTGSSSEDIPNASTKYVGLNKEQAADFDTLLKTYQEGGEKRPAAETRLIALATDERAGLALPILHNLRDVAPNLYKKARALIQDSPLADQLSAEDNNRIALAHTDVPTLFKQAIIRAPGARAELARLAGLGDTAAKTALAAVIKNDTRQGR